MTVKIIIADSCSLILLWKCGALERLADSSKLIVPPKVYNEIVNENTLQIYPDAKNIHDLVKADKIAIEKPSAGAADIPITLGAGETECIQLYTTRNADVILTDDGKAIKVCRYLGIPFTISPKVVVSLFEGGRISFEHARTAILKLEKIGRYARDIIADALLCLQSRRDEP
ncbi:MAG: hypothetical protein GXP58_10820 [Deltaproteobacteria bacterium]|nr:hypothetical protein [Deltaproteobacteria bacterium]